MDEFVYDINLDVEELVASYKKFCDNGCTGDDYDRFFNLAMKLYDKLPTEAEKQDVYALVKQAKHQYDEAEARKRSAEITISPEPVKEPQIGEVESTNTGEEITTSSLLALMRDKGKK